MPKSLCVGLFLGVMVAWAFSFTALAQERDPADEVRAFLTAKGYTVSDVDHSPDDQGAPRPEAMYVLMDAVVGDLDHPDLAAQVLLGLTALYQYYPRASTLSVVLSYKQFWIFFASTRVETAKYMDQTIDAKMYWAGIRRQVQVYDRVKKAYTDEKSFTGTNQTDKDYGRGSTSPVPTPVPQGVKGSALWLEPSTTYLPADGETRAVLMATLLDDNLVGQNRRSVTFTSQAPGQDEEQVGYKTTDANGRALASFQTSANVDGLLLRAATASLNSQVSIVVGPPVKRKADQVQAIQKGLALQGYSGVEVEYVSQTRATGEKENFGYVGMRIASNTFNRAVFAQMSRGLGTVRTIFPQVTQLQIGLVYRKDGRDWQLLWGAQVAHWDQFVAGKMSENDFWRNLQYLGAYDADGHRIDDKNFIDKNFGAGTGRSEARITRSLESSVTAESWGEQWRGQEFVVLPGSYADTFTLVQWSGNATAIQIFQSPDFVTPLVTYPRDDSTKTWSAVRLGQGQYMFSVAAPRAPAAARFTYIEHLPQ